MKKLTKHYTIEEMLKLNSYELKDYYDFMCIVYPELYTIKEMQQCEVILKSK